MWLRSRSASISAVRLGVHSSTVEESETPEKTADQSWWDGITVREVMTSNPLSLTPETSIFTAMEMLTENAISGIPVVDDSGEVVGVVSAYDILTLDSTPGQLDRSDGFFPRIGRCREEFDGDEQAMWRFFFSLRNGIEKARASKVGDSMHDTYCVSANDSISDVANVIVRNNTQRAFVLDENRRLCGVVSRGDILRVTMKKYRDVKHKGQSRNSHSH